MKLYLTNSNQQNAYNKWNPGGIPYVSWKDETNNKTVVVAKNIKNDMPSTVKECTNNCQFIANPIKHYRKQYINLDNNTSGFSNQSYIGSLDKPGGTIISNVDCNNIYQRGYDYILDLKDVTCKDSCLIIKPATTVIDSNYSASNKELLMKKCKTFNQNLPLTTSNTNLTSYPDCKTINNCTPVFTPSNTKYQVQGPISSSARTAAIKHCAQDVDSRRCFLPTTDYNKFGHSVHNKHEPSNNSSTLPGCKCSPKNRKYSRIRILK